MNNEHDLDLDKEELEFIKAINEYKKILAKFVPKEDIVNKIKEIIETDEFMSFSTKNSGKYINENKPVFKIKLKYSDICPDKSIPKADAKKSYIYENLIIKTTNFISDEISGNKDVSELVNKLRTKFKNKAIRNLIVQSIFSILVDKESELCYIEYMK